MTSEISSPLEGAVPVAPADAKPMAIAYFHEDGSSDLFFTGQALEKPLAPGKYPLFLRYWTPAMIDKMNALAAELEIPAVPSHPPASAVMGEVRMLTEEESEQPQPVHSSAAAGPELDAAHLPDSGDAMRAALREVDPASADAYTDAQIARLVAAQQTGWQYRLRLPDGSHSNWSEIRPFPCPYRDGEEWRPGWVHEVREAAKEERTAAPLPVGDADRARYTELAEAAKLAWRALCDAEAVINTIEGEDVLESVNLEELRERLAACAGNLFCQLGLPISALSAPQGGQQQ